MYRDENLLFLNRLQFLIHENAEKIATGLAWAVTALLLYIAIDGLIHKINPVSVGLLFNLALSIAIWKARQIFAFLCGFFCGAILACSQPDIDIERFVGSKLGNHSG